MKNFFVISFLFLFTLSSVHAQTGKKNAHSSGQRYASKHTSKHSAATTHKHTNVSSHKNSGHTPTPSTYHYKSK